MTGLKLDQYADITQWRLEDIPFLEACWVILAALLEDNPEIQMHKAIFNPVIEPDESINEVMVDWQVRGTQLKLCMGRTTTMVFSQNAQDQTFSQFNVDKFIPAMRRVPHVAPEAMNMLCSILEKLVEWGYTARVGLNGTYPVPTLVFDKKDSVVGSLGLLEFTPRNSPKPTIN